MGFQSKREATKAANDALALMKSKGWRRRIWENMGWYAAIQKGHVEIMIHEYADGVSYDAMISDHGVGCGNYCWTSYKNRHRKDPNKAAEIAVKDARRKLNECIKSVEEAEGFLGIEPKKPKKRKK